MCGSWSIIPHVCFMGCHSLMAYMVSLFLSLVVCSGLAIPGELYSPCPQGWPQRRCPLQRQHQQLCSGEGAAGGWPAGCLRVHEQRGSEPRAAGGPDTGQTCTREHTVRWVGRRVCCAVVLPARVLLAPCPQPSTEQRKLQGDGGCLGGGWKMSATSRPVLSSYQVLPSQSGEASPSADLALQNKVSGEKSYDQIITVYYFIVLLIYYFIFLLIDYL